MPAQEMVQSLEIGVATCNDCRGFIKCARVDDMYCVKLFKRNDSYALHAITVCLELTSVDLKKEQFEEEG